MTSEDPAGEQPKNANDAASQYARQMAFVLRKLSEASPAKARGGIDRTGVVRRLCPEWASIGTDAAKKRLASCLGFSPVVRSHFEELAADDVARVLYDWAMTTRCKT